MSPFDFIGPVISEMMANTEKSRDAKYRTVTEDISMFLGCLNQLNLLVSILTDTVELKLHLQAGVNIIYCYRQAGDGSFLYSARDLSSTQEVIASRSMETIQKDARIIKNALSAYYNAYGIRKNKDTALSDTFRSATCLLKEIVFAKCLLLGL
ncbi:hypothetical protein HDV03_004884 [Kappamyces sp. JEL0829]|nr:hypothetical protein HDV03_004884 [Kappamyces sp. JEL0829]